MKDDDPVGDGGGCDDSGARLMVRNYMRLIKLQVHIKKNTHTRESSAKQLCEEHTRLAAVTERGGESKRKNVGVVHSQHPKYIDLGVDGGGR